jgi:hypothetical protein
VAVDRAQLEEGFTSDIDKFSVGTLRDGVREEDLRGHGGKRWKRRLEKKFELWPKTGSSGDDTSWKPYDAVGAKGNKSSNYEKYFIFTI